MHWILFSLMALALVAGMLWALSPLSYTRKEYCRTCRHWIDMDSVFEVGACCKLNCDTGRSDSCSAWENSA